MGEVSRRLAEIPRNLPVCVMCHGGVRSARIAKLLRGEGFSHVLNVSGGIAAWSSEVDPSVPAY